MIKPNGLNRLRNALVVSGMVGLLAACGGDDDESNAEPGTLSGIVKDYYTGEPLAGVAVSLSSQSGTNMNTVATTQTAADGSYQIEGIGISERFLLSAELPQYGAAWDTFGNAVDRSDVSLSPLVLKAHIIDTFDASQENTLSTDGYDVVQLPANSLVDTNGNAYSGEVSTTVTLIDPSSDASIMPGDFVTLNSATGETAQIESFGAIDVNFTDTAGNPLQLQPGQEATISIPLASAISISTAPQTIPLYYFDEEAGYWIEEGEASLTSTSAGYVYQGQVSHFTTWNADQVYDTVTITGCVEDEEGNRVSGARVVASGRDYIGSSSEYTDSSGSFTVPVRRESNILLSSIANAQSDTVAVISTTDNTSMSSCLVLSQGAATITLTWGENPRDLDTHFYGPREEGEGEFEVYYGNKTEEIAGTVFDLDVDDTSSYGPEVLTAPDFPLEGTYRYVVYLFSGTSTIKDSPARVELNLSGEISVFSPDNASGDSSQDYWHVFDLDVDANGNATLRTVQQFTNGESSPAMEASSVNISAQKVLPGMLRHTEGKSVKYYAKD